MGGRRHTCPLARRQGSLAYGLASEGVLVGLARKGDPPFRTSPRVGLARIGKMPPVPSSPFFTLLHGRGRETASHRVGRDTDEVLPSVDRNTTFRKGPQVVTVTRAGEMNTTAGCLSTGRPRTGPPT